MIFALFFCLIFYQKKITKAKRESRFIFNKKKQRKAIMTIRLRDIKKDSTYLGKKIVYFCNVETEI